MGLCPQQTLRTSSEEGPLPALLTAGPGNGRRPLHPLLLLRSRGVGEGSAEPRQTIASSCVQLCGLRVCIWLCVCKGAVCRTPGQSPAGGLCFRPPRFFLAGSEGGS